MRLGNAGLAVSTDDIENGKWFKFPEFETAGKIPEIKIRSCDSELYRRAATKLKVASLSGEDLVDAVRKLTSEVLICGWRGILTEDGAELTYTEEVCAAVCANPDNRRLLTTVFQVASNEHRYDVGLDSEVSEADEKN